MRSSSPPAPLDPQALAQLLYASIVDENQATYRRLFATTSPSKATEPYWVDALGLFTVLDEGQREVFFSVIRQVMIDSVSNALGILDGVSALPGVADDFSLTCGESAPLNGSLQDYFLEQVERLRTQE